MCAIYAAVGVAHKVDIYMKIFRKRITPNPQEMSTAVGVAHEVDINTIYIVRGSRHTLGYKEA